MMNSNGLWHNCSLWGGLSYKVGIFPPTLWWQGYQKCQKIYCKKHLQAKSKVISMFLFCFSFFPSIYFASKGGYYTHNYKPKAARKGFLLTHPQPLCYSQNRLVPCSQHTIAAPWFSTSFSWRYTYWCCIFQKNYTVFPIVQLFCKNYISVLKKSNEMTRHKRWKNSNICFKCHKQQRSAQ